MLPGGITTLAIKLMAGVCFGEPQSALALDGQIMSAITQGQVPDFEVRSSGRRSHREELVVQRYLRERRLKSSDTYQSVFVLDKSQKIQRKVIEGFGYPFVLKSELIGELAVASVGDMQGAIWRFTKEGTDFSNLDSCVVGLTDCDDRESRLKELIKLAQDATNKWRRPIYVEARYYRRLINADLMRPGCEDDVEPESARSGIRRDGKVVKPLPQSRGLGPCCN